MLKLPVDEQDKYTAMQLESVLRCIRRYLSDTGFIRGKIQDSPRVQTDYLIWRNLYLHILMSNCNLPLAKRLREVYTDESYVDHHYSRNEYSVLDPLDVFSKQPKKGKRYCICAAIQVPGRSDSDGLASRSEWIFCPSKEEGSKGDDDKKFDRSTYIDWFQNSLLPNLTEKSLIILGNGFYYKLLPNTAPKPSRMKIFK